MVLQVDVTNSTLANTEAAGIHVIGNGSAESKGTVSVENGSSLKIKESKNVHGLAIATSALNVKDGSALILENANGVSVAEMDVDGSTISIENPNKGTLNIKGSVVDSVITVTNGNAKDSGKVYLYAATVTGTSITTDSIVGIYEQANEEELDLTGSEINAPVVNLIDNSNTGSSASIIGGKITTSAINMDTNTTAITLDGTTIAAKNENGMVSTAGITAGKSGVITEGKVEIKGTVTATEGKIFVKSGALVVPSNTTGIIPVGGTATAGTETVAPATKGTATTIGEIQTMIDVELKEIEFDLGTGNISGRTLSTDLVIPEGYELKRTAGNGICLGDYNVIVQGGTLNNVVLISQNENTDQIIADGLTGNYTVGTAKAKTTGAAGTTDIVIDGNVDGGVITVKGDGAIISGVLSGDLEIKGETESANVFFGDFTINAGAEITMNKLSYNVIGKTVLYGSMIPVTGVEPKITVDAAGEFVAFAGAQLSGKINVTGAGKIDLSLAQNPQNVGEDISSDKIYGQLENVTIVDTLNIRNNSTVTILGGFNVNEGVVLTIEKGSTLKIDSAAASMIVNGKIVVEEGANLIVERAKDVEISGALESEGVVDIKSTVTVKTDGKILADEADGSKFIVGQGLTIEAGAELEIRSKFSATTVANKGLVVLNGAMISGTVKINMAADSAVVEVRSFVSTADSGSASVVISDEGMELNKDKDTVSEDDANKITLSAQKEFGFKGLIITESIVKKTVDGDPVYENYMDVSGTLAYVDERSETGTAISIDDVTVSGPRLTVAGELTVGTKVTLNVTGTMAVSGKITAVAEGSVIKVTGEMSVTGLVQTVKKIENATQKLDAAMYEQTVSGVTNYYYTNLKAAVESDATTINVYGTVKVDESFTVAAEKTIKNDGKIVVGSSSKRDVVLTFADGSTLKNGTVDVKGTLEFDNKKSNKATEVISDTAVIGEVKSRYTNIYTALNEAESGDVVTITNNETVKLNANITIKDGVTLEVPNSKTLEVGEGVTLTIDGTLKSVDMVYAESREVVDGVIVESGFAETASNKLGEEASAIVVNGTLMTMAETSYGYYQIAGAYYNIVDSVGDYHYITPLEAAAAVAADAEGKTYGTSPDTVSVDAAIEVYGKVTAGDVKFTGTEDVHISVIVYGELTVSSITLEETTFHGFMSGTVIAEDAQVVANKAVVFASSYADDEIGMILEGWTVDYDGEEEIEDSKINVTSGKAYIAYADGITVDAGATAIISKDVDAVCTADDMIVNGTLEIEAEATLDAGILTINGTLTVSEGTDTKNAGALNVKNMYVGVSEEDVDKDYTGADASVSGPVNIGEKAVVLNGSVLSESTTKSMKDMKSTAYDVEGSVWITVYAKSGSGVLINEIDKVPVENAKFGKAWNDENKKPVGAGVAVGTPGYETVYAVIDYEIYDVFVYANDGIANVYLNGDIMKKGSIDEGGKTIQGFMATVKAGDYTITFDLAQGWDGDVTMKVNGKDVSGTSFKASGVNADDSNVQYMVQLSGVEKSDAPVTPVAPSGDDGMTITDYLLIILVVLIVVMAIIVAMRLMRS